MTVQHRDISDPEIHEPKGISTASAGTVYVANGAGSGSFELVGAQSLVMSDIFIATQDGIDSGLLKTRGRFLIHTVIPDVSTASSVLIPIPFDCIVISGMSVLGGTISGDNAVVEFKDSLGNSMGTPITVVYSGSDKGDVGSFTATANNVLTGPTWIEVTSDGASTGTVPLYVSLVIEYVTNQEFL